MPGAGNYYPSPNRHYFELAIDTDQTVTEFKIIFKATTKINAVNTTNVIRETIVDSSSEIQVNLKEGGIITPQWKQAVEINQSMTITGLSQL